MTPVGGGVRLEVAHSRELSTRLPTGASLAVSGVCLTVVTGEEGRTVMVLAPETLSRTTLGALREGDEVNLEPALRVGDALGGHWVQGHVDGTVAVHEIRTLEDHREMTVELPAEHVAYVVSKGSVTLDGVSLTVAGLDAGVFRVALVPHTLQVTTLGERRPGDRLNLETDVLAKYVAQALCRREIAAGS